MRMMPLLTSICLASAMLPLSAERTEAGIQGSLVFPQSDLRSEVRGRTGFQVGVHGAIDLQGGNELRPRIDYTRIDGGAFSFNSFSGSHTVKGVGLGVDYLRYYEQRPRGLYGLGGIELIWWDARDRDGASVRETAPSLKLGVGHRFDSRVSMEFSVDYGKFRPAFGTASSIKGGVFYRF